MQFTDALELGRPRRTKDGYLAVRARAARTGVYRYTGREIDPNNDHGLRDAATVNVLRDEATVFDERAARTFVGKPITVDHPSEPVTAANWKDHARGAIMGALRDGDYLAFDLLLMDADAIADVDAGKRDLSNGYVAELEFGDFTAADGTKCPARQARITDGNHVAIVDHGRAGADCRLADGGNSRFENCDAATVFITVADQEPNEMTTHTLTIDGLRVTNVSDEAKAAIEKLQGQVSTLTTAKDAADKKVGELTAAVETKDGEIKALEQKVKDAEVTPDKLQALADARAKVIAAAQSLKAGIVTDGKTDAEIRKDAVAARLGDEATKDMSDAAIEGAFAALTKDAKPAGPGNVTPIHSPANVADSASIRDAARAARYA